MKKILSLFLFLGLFLMATTVRAAETFEVTNFEELKAHATGAANDRINLSGEITFTEDLSVTPYIVVMGETTLNLGGYTLTLPDWSNYNITAKAKLTIDGNGKIVTNGLYGITVSGGELVINNGEFVGENADYLISTYDGAITINDGKFTANYYCVNNLSGLEGSYYNPSKVTIKGGTFTTSLAADKDDDYFCILSSANMDISGATITGDVEAEATAIVNVEETKVTGRFYAYEQSQINIKSGEFSATGDDYILNDEDDAVITVTGGEFPNGELQNSHMAEGYKNIPAGDNDYEVVKIHYLTVKYLIDGNEEQEVSIIDPQRVPYGEGEPYEATELNAADVPEGYRLIRTDGNKNGTMGTSDVTVTFYYSNEYTLTLETNGGREIEAMTSTPDEGPAIALANFNDRTEKEGYELAGWYSDEDLTKELTSWNRDEDVTAYAKWTPIKYTIKYNLDGGEAENPTEYTIESEDIKLNNPEKEGFRFVDWKDDEDHALGMEVTIPKGSTGNKGFNAFYEVEQFKVTIGDKEIMADYGSSVDVTIDEYKLEKEGYEFLGYFYEDSPVENIIVREDIVLTPKFKFIYKMLSDPQTYVLNSNVEMVLKTNGEIDNLREVMVDGKALLAEQEVKITSGSTIATFIPSYLNTLSVGEHKVTFVYNDGELNTTFNVTEDKEETPKTGDDIMKSVCALICSTMTFGLSLGLRKKFN